MIRKRILIHLAVLAFIPVSLALIYLNKLSIPQERHINVLLITIDALRPDHMGCYGYPRNTTPNIDKLAEEGIIFTQAISQAPITSPSVGSLLTGLYPSRHGVIKDVSPLNYEITLPVILKNNKYLTTAIINQPNFNKISNFNRGFINYIDIAELEDKEKNAKTISEIAVKWLEKNYNKHFFLWLHYLDPHGPYNPPCPYDKTFLNDRFYREDRFLQVSNFECGSDGGIPKYLFRDNITNIDYYIAQYDGEIRFTDEQIGILLEKLKKLKIFDKTLIVITADHGEAMGEHSQYFVHVNSMYDEFLRVPLIIRLPNGLLKNKKIGFQVRSIDIMPTILDLLEIKIKNLDGCSLMPLMLGRVNKDPNLIAYSDVIDELMRVRIVSIRLMNKWKFILHQDLSQSVNRDSIEITQLELYDLENDPQELNNLSDSNENLAIELKNRLIAWMSQVRPENYYLEPALNEATKERLRNLGYAQ